MDPQVAGMAISVAAIIGIASLVEQFVTNQVWHPVICVLVGVGANVGLAFFFVEPLTRAGIGTAIVLGITSGLAAAGLYTGVSAVAARVNRVKRNVPPSPRA